jgi:hypothetical protein
MENKAAVTEEELARARELVEHEPNYSPFNHDLYRLDLDKVYSLMARHARQEREAERERIAPQSQWKTLPDEQAWWWYWTGSDYAVPHICSVMVSKTGAKDRYFVADGNLAPWCDEMEGFWLKIDYPNVPTRAEQK